MGQLLKELLTGSTVANAFERGEKLLAAVLASRWFPERAAYIPQLEAKSDLIGWQTAIHWHGLAGILKQYHSEALAHLSPAFRDSLNKLHLHDVTQALHQFTLTKAVLTAMQEAGILAIPIKGTILSVHLYGNIGARNSNDIDVLVDPDDFERACHLMVELGYQPRFDLFGDIHTIKHVLALHKDVSFSRSDEPRIELHFRNEPDLETSLPRLSEIQGMQSFRYQGLRCLTLGPNELRNSIAQHALRSSVSRWKWGYDVVQLVSTTTNTENPFYESNTHSRAEDICLQVLAQEWNIPMKVTSHRISARLIVGAGRARRRYCTSTHGHKRFIALLKLRLLQIPATSAIYEQWKDRLCQVNTTIKIGWHPSHSNWQAFALTRLPPAGIVIVMLRSAQRLIRGLTQRSHKGTNKPQ